MVRMASIPHGTTIDAEGAATPPVAGGPHFQPVDITPFPIGNPGSRETGVFPSQQASDNATWRLPQDLTSFIAAGTPITQPILDNPNSILQTRASSQNITSTTTFTVDTTRPAPSDPGNPLFGGGHRQHRVPARRSDGAAPESERQCRRANRHILDRDCGSANRPGSHGRKPSHECPGQRGGGSAHRRLQRHVGNRHHRAHPGQRHLHPRSSTARSCC